MPARMYAYAKKTKTVEPVTVRAKHSVSCGLCRAKGFTAEESQVGTFTVFSDGRTQYESTEHRTPCRHVRELVEDAKRTLGVDQITEAEAVLFGHVMIDKFRFGLTREAAGARVIPESGTGTPDTGGSQS